MFTFRPFFGIINICHYKNFKGGNIYMAKMNFADIKEALYSAKDIDDIQKRHIKNLRAEGSVHNLLYANKLEEGENMLSITNLHELEGEFHDLKEYLRNWAKQHNIHLILKRRKKDWIGVNEKIQLFLSEGKPLDKILDLLGFRIILGSTSTDNIDNIKLCYELQNEVMHFFIKKKHCIFLEAEPKIDINFDPNNNKEIIVPKTSLLDKEFELFVKDYVRYPKWNAYQSLHSVVRKPNGLFFELQIRTCAMDILAEYGEGEHKIYKDKRYENLDFNIDYSKISIPGFTVLPDGSINDIVGLRKSVDPFNFL